MILVQLLGKFLPGLRSGIVSNTYIVANGNIRLETLLRCLLSVSQEQPSVPLRMFLVEPIPKLALQRYIPPHVPSPTFPSLYLFLLEIAQDAMALVDRVARRSFE